MKKRYCGPSDAINLVLHYYSLSRNWILPIEKPEFEFCFALIIMYSIAATQRMIDVDSRSTIAPSCSTNKVRLNAPYKPRGRFLVLFGFLLDTAGTLNFDPQTVPSNFVRVAKTGGPRLSSSSPWRGKEAKMQSIRHLNR